jgi:hypothetical protein
MSERIRAADLCRVYVAAVEFDKDDKVQKAGNCKRSFCSECSSMLWNYHDEYPDVSQRTGHDSEPSNPNPNPNPNPNQQLLRSECTLISIVLSITVDLPLRIDD